MIPVTLPDIVVLGTIPEAYRVHSKTGDSGLGPSDNSDGTVIPKWNSQGVP